jgi:hypothetical protein
MSELCKAVPGLGNLKKNDRDGLLHVVCDTYPVEQLQQKNGKGRPSIIHRWIFDAVN